MNWEIFLIAVISDQYALTPMRRKVLLAKFPDENTVLTNKEVADQLSDKLIQDNKEPLSDETIAKHWRTIYKNHFSTKDNYDGFPGYDKHGNFDKDVEFRNWLRQKYSELLKTQNYNNSSASPVITDSNKGGLQVNPFIPITGIINDSEFFFGRSQEIRQIFEVINSGSSVALIGEEGIGKSSLLWAICQQAETYLSSPRQAVYLNLSDVQDEDDFYSALCQEVGIPESKGYSLSRALRSHRVLLAIETNLTHYQKRNEI